MVYIPQNWATGPTGGTPLSADRLNAMEQGIAQAHHLSGGLLLDSFPGDDDAKLTAAIAAQKSIEGMPAIILSARNHRFNQTRTLYSGLKLVGSRPSGPKNLEISSSRLVPSRVTLGPGVSSGASSWWVGTGDVFDVFMADFGVSGNSGSSVHQFLDFPFTAGTLYSCEFRSLSFDFMRAVFGRKDRPCAITAVTFSGHWTANNLWDTQFTLGGSDSQLWVGGQINIGPSAHPAQTGTLADNDYQIIFSSLSKTNVGYLYITALNGWRGLKITGNSGFGLFFYGGTFEGYKPTGSLAAGPAPGTVIRIEGGSGAFYGPGIGQGMNAPDSSERGLVHMTGGEWSFIGASFFRGSMPETVPCIYQSGGRLLVMGATRPQNESWSNRPRYVTTASGRTSTQTSFYCVDGSMVKG